VWLARLTVPAMQALLRGDLATASEEVGVPMTDYLLDHAWLWRIRLDQVALDDRTLDWIARVAVDAGTGDVVGHVGFHGPPDERGMVEVAYSVDPAYRRRGYARSMLAEALSWAAAEPEVTVVRASVSPGNEASLATLRPFGFVPAGEQWDDEDGQELLFELLLERG
jgi:[ribosomal protein S5]-alanine N-acetyltransferase